MELDPPEPADAVDAPRPDKPDMAPLSADERAALLDAARADAWEGLYITALGTGMRVSELLGLRWANVDFGAATITVMGQVKRTKAGGLHLDDTKSTAPI